jgi:predicted ATPase/class 3 adenylate cyclase
MLTGVTSPARLYVAPREATMPELPHGTVTLLFTDIEGSTRLLQHLGDRYADVLAEHRDILREAFAAHNGYEVDTQGDSFFIAFQRATQAVAAAVTAQRALVAHPWPEGGSRSGDAGGPALPMVRVRMGLHTGEPSHSPDGGGFVGMDVHRAARLCSAGYGGQILLSQSTADLAMYDLPAGVSLRDMGEHRLKDLVRPEHVFQIVASDLPDQFPPLKTLETRPNNLPVQRAALIGREPLVAAALRLLNRSDVGLLTLTGPGGSGKTRLGLHVAADLIGEFDDGVFFVGLALISDPALVPATIARTLGVREVEGRQILTRLTEHLRDKELLLVLDNFEQVLDAAPLVSDLLASCPRLTVLVTSRAALKITGEHELPVPPLALPPVGLRVPGIAGRGDGDLVTAVSQYAAVALFIERATAARPDFTVTNENAAAVAEICARLDGLPLAIELAAVRVKLLSPQAMLPRLESRLKLLTGGARDLPARQQTLRGAIGWGYDLLSPGEQQLFRRLAVFVGGCTLDAAETVCNADGDLEIDLLDGAASLVDKSLLRQEEQDNGEPRFVMLETIREYALERMDASGEESALLRNHIHYFLALAEESSAWITSAERGTWLKRLDAEHDNLRSALAWSLTPIVGDEVTLRLAGALWGFWQFRGHVSEGRRWLDTALELPGAQDRSPARARALYGAGNLAYLQGNDLTARSHFEESVALWRSLESTRGLTYALASLGLTAARLHEDDIARALYEESLELCRQSGDAWGQAFTLIGLGDLALGRRDIDAARPLLDESLALYQQTGDRWGVALALNSLGFLALREGEDAAAITRFEEALALLREEGDTTLMAGSLHNLALVAQGQGDTRQAATLFKGSLVRFRDLGNTLGVAWCLEALAAFAGAEGRHERAVRLAAAVQVLVDATGFRPRPEDRAEHDHILDTARASLGDEPFSAALAAGRAMTLEQAVAEALEETGAGSTSPLPSPGSALRGDQGADMTGGPRRPPEGEAPGG